MRAVRVLRHELGQGVFERDADSEGDVPLLLDGAGAVAEALAVGSFGALAGGADQLCPGGKLDSDLLAGLDALAEVAPPGLEGVRPAFEAVTVAAYLADVEAGLPAIVAERVHAHCLPGGRVDGGVADLAAKLIAAVEEDIGLHRHRFAGGALHAEAPAVNFGRNVGDYHTP